MKRYIVRDNNGEPSGIPFHTIEDAECYKTIFGIPSWKIELVDAKVKKKSAKNMQKCVRFAEQFSGHIFDGDIENYFDCKEFLKSHWKTAVELSFLKGVITTPAYEDNWLD